MLSKQILLLLISLSLVLSQNLVEAPKDGEYDYFLELGDQRVGIAQVDLDQLKLYFNSFDTNKDGLLDQIEVMGFIKKTYPDYYSEVHSEEDFEDFIAYIDLSGDGQISLNEFLVLGLMDDNDLDINDKDSQENPTDQFEFEVSDL